NLKHFNIIYSGVRWIPVAHKILYVLTIFLQVLKRPILPHPTIYSQKNK
uniref:Uncharacterized protein n=1 Tax=Ciona intestinalis TaxID=7719 RepID=H2XYE2_CIOIN